MEQGRPSYGWRRVAISDGGQAIGRAKTEGRNSNRGVWYKFYSKSSVCQKGLQASRAVMQLQPALDLLRNRIVLQGVLVPEHRLTVH